MYLVWFFINLVLTSRHSKNPIFGIKLARLLVSAGNKNEISTFLWTNIHFILTLFPNLSNFWWLIPNSAVHINKIELQVILFEIDCAIFFLCKTKNWITYGATHFVPALNMDLLFKCKSSFGLAEKTVAPAHYINQFLVWDKNLGLIQTVLGPVKGQGSKQDLYR